MSGPQVVVEISSDGKYIDLFSPYFTGVNDMCKQVPGARPAFNKETGKFSHWRYPKNTVTCRRFREIFTDLLIVGEELADWYRKQDVRERRLARLTKKTDADLYRVPEALPRIDAAMASRTYQRVGAAFMAQADQGVLLGDQPGLGKTIQTLAGIVERGVEEGIHLVAPPATAIEIVWAKEIRKWTDWPVFCATGGAARRKKTIAAFFDEPARTKFLIANPEMLRTVIGRWCKKCDAFEEELEDDKRYYFNAWVEGCKELAKMEKDDPENPRIEKLKISTKADNDEVEAIEEIQREHRMDSHKTVPKVYKQNFPELFVPEWSSITVDECHRFLTGIRSPVQKTQVGEGFCRLQLKKNGLKVGLSGTPAKGKPINFWGAFHWLDPGFYRSKWQWAEQYLEVSDNGFGKTIGGVRPERETEFYRSLDTIMLRRTKSEVAKDLPPKDLQEHWLDPGPKQLKQYRDMVQHGEAAFGSKIVSSVGVLSELTRLKQIATAYQDENGPVLKDSCKWNYLLEMLQERGVVGPEEERYGDSKFVIASQFTQVINAMEIAFRDLGVEVLKITGEVTTKQRLAAQQAFQAKGGVRIILINTMAGGVAIDLDQQCDELFFMDETFVPDDQEQVEDRIHRVSRIHQVTIHYFYSRGSIDEAIAMMNVAKDELQKKILDGRRGVEFALRLLKEIA